MTKLPRMICHMIATSVAVALGSAALAPPARAFDTWWHNAATAAAGKQFGLSPDALNLLQAGDFAPDLYGPLWDQAFVNLPEWIWPYIPRDTMARAARERSAIVLHFDNLEGKLDDNRKLDALWQMLLENTRAALVEARSADVPDPAKKVLVLLTLGASLHMVQDFYSHSDWTHLDFSFARLGAEDYVATPWNGDRTPTWFEVLRKCGDPAAWPKVTAGVYPPVGPASHDDLAHDNSQLFMGYSAARYMLGLDAGGSARAARHDLGPYPTSKVGPLEHMRYAVRSASAAGVEWVTLVREDLGAKSALDWAGSVDLDREDRLLLRHLEGALVVTSLFGCIAGHFDGPVPQEKNASMCRGFKKDFLMAMTTASASPIFIAARLPWKNALIRNYPFALTRLTKGFNVGGAYPEPFPVRPEPPVTERCKAVR